MASQPQSNAPILNIAWTRYAQLDASSNENNRPYYRLRKWIAILGVTAALLAVLSQSLSAYLPAIVALILKTLLIATPIAASVMAAYVNKFFSGSNWLVARAGAEEIQKEIYFYRTVLKNQADRRAWLEKRLNEIQRQVYRGLGGELILKPYKGNIPPYHYPDDPNSDPGFADLTGDEYFRYRLQGQLAWHIKKVNQFQHERTRLQLYILATGGGSALLAAWGGDLALWVAVTSALVAALTGWQELKNYDPTVRNYSKVIMELLMIHDHWMSLSPEERTESEFYTMVRSTEDILWSQNMEYIRDMQEAALGAQMEQAQLVDQVIKKSVESDRKFQKAMRDTIVENASRTMDESREKLEEHFEEVVGSLAEEASSELVQQELAAMAAAAQNAAQAVAAHFTRVSDTLAQIAKEYAHVEIGTQTPKETLNEIMSRYPTSGEVKG